MKTLLLLGGSAQQVVAIETAKRLGCRTVLCDYLPDNPGQYAADRFYLVSTTDLQAVLDVARRERVDGVLAYASDPAAPTAAYVAQTLGLPGNPYRSAHFRSRKQQFQHRLTFRRRLLPQQPSVCAFRFFSSRRPIRPRPEAVRLSRPAANRGSDRCD